MYWNFKYVLLITIHGILKNNLIFFPAGIKCLSRRDHCKDPKHTVVVQQAIQDERAERQHSNTSTIRGQHQRALRLHLRPPK